MRKNYFLLFLVSVSLFQGCATIIKGSKQEIIITSYPAKASIYINGQPHGETPAVVRLMRADDQYISIEMEGYEPYETVLYRKLNGWIFGNILLGGLIGIAIDAATGSMYSLTPDQVNAHFRSDSGNLYKSKDGIYVGVTLRPDPSWKKIGEMERE